MKNSSSIIRRLMVVFMQLTATTAWAQGVNYLDASGTQQTCSTYTTMTNSTTSWSDGWYVVSSSTTINNRISVSGTVNLILCNGATLTANNGIGVGSDATFNVYAQSEDEATMGALTATISNTADNSYCARIGGNNQSNFGSITINGGKITATGFSYAAGIGGGYGSNSGNITINGGIVVANAGDYSYSAGIGGGYSGYVNSITLNGGTISATGDTQYGGAGIGTGTCGGSGTMTITITSGVKQIIATKGYSSDCIGKVSNATTAVNVVFKHNNNEVTGDAKNAVFYDTGEGASSRTIRGNVVNHSITISDNIKASVTANTTAAPEGETITLTVGTAVDVSTLKVNDGTNDLTLTDIGNRQYTFVMPNSDVTVTATAAATYSVTLPANMEIVSATNTADGDGKYISGTVVTFKVSFPAAATNVSDGTNTLTADGSGNYSVTIDNADITITATIQRSATIDLSDAPGNFTAINNDVLTGSTSHTVTIADGAGITLSDATITGGIVCEGTAEITLVGENVVYQTSLNANNKISGIQIGGTGTTLTIKGNGSLTATGGSDAAGIGLGRTWDANATGGSVVIEGGTVTASGGNGIGTGTVGNNMTASLDGIVIKGGTVNASLGNGNLYYGSSVTISAVKIYDGIEKVDASKITTSVTYMHVENETETDVTASASDYFTIIEDGDRRVITPKDETDYTITIVDGIEHGSITGAATAKYGDQVTITATPDFGYRLSSLVVKDAQNNDVASTGNSFIMPKSNVTVSAVFEHGTHGTTEFAWSHWQQGQGWVTDATIYDGITTVYMNKNVTYSIIRYEGSSYSQFLLDNNAFNVYIPYAGGTGTFVSTNPTNFKLNNDGDEGFYDITMTDVENGKWSVSIQKTVAVIDNIPDQEYTGSAITPEPLVLAGSLNITKGTDYEYSYTNNTNAGTAKVTVTFKGDYASIGSVEKEFLIKKQLTHTDITISIPSQEWTGSELTPVITVKDGETTLTVGTDYTVTAPIGTLQNSGDYTYTISGAGNYSGETTATFTISPKAIGTYGTIAVTEDQNGKTATIDASLEATIEISSDIEVNQVALQRSFTANQPATVMLPFSLGTGQTVNGGSFYKFSGVVKDGDIWKAQFTEAATLKANTPYLFNPSADGNMTFNLNNGTVRLNTTTTGESGNTTTNWEFHGTYQKVMWNGSTGGNTDPSDISKTYGFAKGNGTTIAAGQFVHFAAGAWLKPMRCYLVYNGSTEGGTFQNARRMTRGAEATEELPQTITLVLLSSNGGTTSIGTIDTQTGEISFDGWYTMDGRKLDGKPTKKGLYINNGRKVVIK